MELGDSLDMRLTGVNIGERLKLTGLEYIIGKNETSDLGELNIPINLKRYGEEGIIGDNYIQWKPVWGREYTDLGIFNTHVVQPDLKDNFIFLYNHKYSF